MALILLIFLLSRRQAAAGGAIATILGLIIIARAAWLRRAARAGVATLGIPALEISRAGWAQFVHRDFAVLVLIELLERLGSIADFFFVNHSVVVDVECCDERRDGWALTILRLAAWLRTTGRALAFLRLAFGSRAAMKALAVFTRAVRAAFALLKSRSTRRAWLVLVLCRYGHG
jgi:hypothetical protein